MVPVPKVAVVVPSYALFEDVMPDTVRALAVTLAVEV